MAGIYACGEKAPPASQNQVVKKKIAVQQKKPTVKSATAKTKSDISQNKISTPAGEKAGQETGSAVVNKEPENAKSVSELIRESIAVEGAYDPKGRFDPFEPLFKEESSEPVVASKGKRTKRTPQTPLERVALSQLKLSAIMRTPKGNSAIVEDATGKGYVIKKGTYIGLNSGQVVQVDQEGVLIEEEVEDVSGEIRIKNTELKLQKPAGEL